MSAIISEDVNNMTKDFANIDISPCNSVKYIDQGIKTLSLISNEKEAVRVEEIIVKNCDQGECQIGSTAVEKGQENEIKLEKCEAIVTDVKCEAIEEGSVKHENSVKYVGKCESNGNQGKCESTEKEQECEQNEKAMKCEVIIIEGSEEPVTSPEGSEVPVTSCDVRPIIADSVKEEDAKNTDGEVVKKGPGNGSNAVPSQSTQPGNVQWPLHITGNVDDREPLPSAKYLRKLPEENDETVNNWSSGVTQGSPHHDVMFSQSSPFNITPNVPFTQTNAFPFQSHQLNTPNFQFTTDPQVVNNISINEQYNSDEIKKLISEASKLDPVVPSDGIPSISDIINPPPSINNQGSPGSNHGNSPSYVVNSPSANSMAHSPNDCMHGLNTVASPGHPYTISSPHSVVSNHGSPHSVVSNHGSPHSVVSNHGSPHIYGNHCSPDSQYMCSPDSQFSNFGSQSSPGSHSSNYGNQNSPGSQYSNHNSPKSQMYKYNDESSPMFSQGSPNSMDDCSRDTTLHQVQSPDSGMYDDNEKQGINEIAKELEEEVNKKFGLTDGHRIEDVLETLNKDILNEQFNKPLLNQSNQPDIITYSPLPHPSLLPQNDDKIKTEPIDKKPEKEKRPRGRPPGSKNKPKIEKKQKKILPNNTTPTTLIIMPPVPGSVSQTALVIPTTTHNKRLLLPKMNQMPTTLQKPVSVLPTMQSIPVPVTNGGRKICETVADPSDKEKRNNCRAARLVADIPLDKLNYQDSDGDTILHDMSLQECYQDFLEIISPSLLTIGVVKDRYMFRALIERMEREGCLENMINKCNKLKQTPLYLAVCTNKPELLSLLIEKKADPNTWTYGGRNSGFKRPLHVAAEKGREYLPILQVLLKAPDIDVNCKNSEQKTALHCAVDGHGQNTDGTVIDNKETVKLLIQSKAKIMPGPNEKTPLHTLVERLDLDFLKFMVELINPSEVKDALNMRDSNGNTCLHIVASIAGRKDQSGHNSGKVHQILSYLINTIEVDFTIQNQKSETAKKLCKENKEALEYFAIAERRRRNLKNHAANQNHCLSDLQFNGSFISAIAQTEPVNFNPSNGEATPIRREMIQQHIDSTMVGSIPGSGGIAPIQVPIHGYTSIHTPGYASSTQVTGGFTSYQGGGSCRFVNSGYGGYQSRQCDSVNDDVKLLNGHTGSLCQSSITQQLNTTYNEHNIQRPSCGIINAPFTQPNTHLRNQLLNP